MTDVQVPSGLAEVAAFVRGYTPDQVDRIRFAWNGKHAEEFVDANQDFRVQVVEHVWAAPGEAS